MKDSEARERLTKVREEFRSAVDAVKERLAQPERDATDIAVADQHPADIATETADRELDLGREVMFEARLGQIDDAFGRLENGTYGLCIVCGQPIPDERLALLPDTPYCVKDATREQARAS